MANAGSSRRHNPQRGSPSAATEAYGVISLSPQIAQTPPAIGRMSERHARQTGRREILIKGAPQRRQSEGKSVAKRLSATPLTEETRQDTSELPGGPTLVPVARIGFPLLLKTNLPCSPGSRQPQNSRIFLSIAVDNVHGNDSTARQLRRAPFWIRDAPALLPTRYATIAGNNHGSARDG